MGINLIKLCWFLKVLFGFGSVRDGSICWFSREFLDVHDYPVKKGGDGYPSHFYYYTCWRCGNKFMI